MRSQNTPSSSEHPRLSHLLPFPGRRIRRARRITVLLGAGEDSSRTDLLAHRAEIVDAEDGDNKSLGNEEKIKSNRENLMRTIKKQRR